MGDAQIMPPINYNPLKEGDDLNADSLNDRFSETAGAGQGVNNLAQGDLERDALRQEHLPRIITASDFPNGLVKLAPTGTLVSNPYVNRLNDVAGVDLVVPVPDYQTFDLGAPNGPYGPPTTEDRGWRIIADSNLTANAAEIEFGPLTASTVTDSIGNYKGILVRLGVGYDSFAQGFGAPSTEYSAVAVAIGWEDNLGNRNVVERSIRWFNSFSVIKGSLETFTFIKPEDIGNTNQINKVFGVIAGAHWGVTDPGFNPPIIRYYNLDIMPIRAGELE